MQPARLYSLLPLSLDQALVADPIRWSVGEDEREIHMAARPLSFVALRVFQRAMKAIRLQIAGMQETDLDTLLAKEANEDGGPGSMREIRETWAKLFPYEAIEYLSDLLVGLSQPIDLRAATRVLGVWGNETARSWYSPGMAWTPDEFRNALSDYCANEMDPVDCSAICSKFWAGCLEVKKKLLNPEPAGTTSRQTPLRKVWRTLRALDKSRSLKP
jgi:hypothetical protein